MSPKRIISAATALAAVMLTAAAVEAGSNDEHKMVPPQDIAWTPGPASLPKGAEAAVLYGDPSKEGLFALRLKLPKDYRIPPHTHPKPEVVTVISGTFRVGMGQEADRNSAQALATGSFMALPPETAHFAFADEDTVIQLNSVGPWSLTYVNPKDDPRGPSQ